MGSRPRMLGMQAAGAAPLVEGAPVANPETVASAIRIGNPARWEEAIDAMRASRGSIRAVSDAEIIDAYRFLAAHEGVFCEPASAASVAGLLKYGVDGAQKVACVLTGHGLKDPQTALSLAGSVVPCEPEIAAVERADGLRFTVRSDIPLSGGLGSSAAAVVAGLLAADAMTGGDGDVLAMATELEGHPDNVAAALLGGFVICAGPAPQRLEVPAGLGGVLVVPDVPVPTRQARAALPDRVPMADAVFNVGAASLLTLGLARQDLPMIATGLGDRLHQPHRAHLYPRSAALLVRAPELGGIGATISGAGPTVLVWCAEDARDAVAGRLRVEAEDWADVLPVAFSPRGAEVAAL